MQSATPRAAVIFAVHQLAASRLLFVPLPECSGEHQGYKKQALVGVGSTGHLFDVFICSQPRSAFVLDLRGQQAISFPGDLQSPPIKLQHCKTTASNIRFLLPTAPGKPASSSLRPSPNLTALHGGMHQVCHTGLEMGFGNVQCHTEVHRKYLRTVPRQDRG